MADDKARAKTTHNLDDLGVSFTTYERPNVREQLRYWSRVRETLELGDMFERYWEGAKTLIMDWQCEYMPLDGDLSASDDPRWVSVIQTVGMTAYSHIRKLDVTPKN